VSRNCSKYDDHDDKDDDDHYGDNDGSSGDKLLFRAESFIL
jgi:hypothetical protein